MKLYFVLLVYNNFDNSIEKLNDYIHSYCKKFDTKIVIVDNSEQKEFLNNNSGKDIIIAGDNSYREFSGYDIGFNYTKKKFTLAKRDLIVFVNDTIGENNASQVLSLFTLPIYILAKLGFFTGYVDYFSDHMLVNKLRTKKWVRTHFFILNYSNVLKLYPFTKRKYINCVLGNSKEKFFTETIESNYSLYLEKWLFGPSNFHKNKWKNYSELNENNFVFFKKKCSAIILEHYLSAQSREMRVPIFPVNWKKILKKRIKRMKQY